MSTTPMFTDEELEVIEEALTEVRGEWGLTHVEQRLFESILNKIDKHLNG